MRSSPLAELPWSSVRAPWERCLPKGRLSSEALDDTGTVTGVVLPGETRFDRESGSTKSMSVVSASAGRHGAGAERGKGGRGVRFGLKMLIRSGSCCCSWWSAAAGCSSADDVAGGAGDGVFAGAVLVRPHRLVRWRQPSERVSDPRGTAMMPILSPWTPCTMSISPRSTSFLSLSFSCSPVCSFVGVLALAPMVAPLCSFSCCCCCCC
mmetsp:Transcript_35853/g.89331  ORF Transcript_35853/g.89331 Transcript_35853/m.89331 type:complete len:209 (-) Transcript_35853:129-755(-)